MTLEMKHEKPIYWVGTSYKDLLTFPPEVKQVAGYQLHLIQNGFEPENWKPFQTIGAGVKEIRITEDGNAYRIMYIAKFSERIYVLHSFKKRPIAKFSCTAVYNESIYFSIFRCWHIFSSG